VLKKHTLRNAISIARFSSLTQNNLVTWLIGENFEDGGVSAGENAFMWFRVVDCMTLLIVNSGFGQFSAARRD
jgi:hypothetical protein